ncbi:MAG: TVP38/TMEM64 family protein [Myxococcota bacterium]
MSRASWVRVVVVVGFVALLAVFLTHVDAIAAWLQWLDGLGPAGDLLFVIGYVSATIGMVPASILEASAGFLYGAATGIPVGILVGTGAATTSFLLGRTVFRRAVERRIAADPRWFRIDEAIRADGLKLVFLLRLSPLAPFNLLSPMLGATPVSIRDFVLGTAAGHLFPVVVFAYTGSTVASALDLVARPGLPPWATAVALGLTVVATIGVSRFAKRALDAALAPPVVPVGPTGSVASPERVAANPDRP